MTAPTSPSRLAVLLGLLTVIGCDEEPTETSSQDIDDLTAQVDAMQEALDAQSQSIADLELEVQTLTGADLCPGCLGRAEHR